jgi:hypothetical protein
MFVVSRVASFLFLNESNFNVSGNKFSSFQVFRVLRFQAFSALRTLIPRNLLGIKVLSFIGIKVSG